MKICDILKEATIIVPMNATDRDSAIQELLNKLVCNEILTSSSKLLQHIEDIEN